MNASEFLHQLVVSIVLHHSRRQRSIRFSVGLNDVFNVVLNVVLNVVFNVDFNDIIKVIINVVPNNDTAEVNCTEPPPAASNEAKSLP